MLCIGPLQSKLKKGTSRQKELTALQNDITVYLSKIVPFIHHLCWKDCHLQFLFYDTVMLLIKYISQLFYY